MHLEAISNGLGGQSIWLLVLAGEGIIPATVSITADTGAENDCLWNTGERTTSKEYYDQVVKPLCDRYGIESAFVRAVDKDKQPLPAIGQSFFKNGKKSVSIPLYGSLNGQISQTCTSKWKIAAINQEARRRGAKTMRTAQGIHLGEAARRVKGKYIGKIDGFDTYRKTIKNKKTKVETEIKWLSHYYPLVDLRLNRQQVRERLEKKNIPYLISSECDFCPHKDYPRWARSSPETIERAAQIEAQFNGEYFLTDLRIPLKRAIEKMRQAEDSRGYLFGRDDVDFGCGNSYCGV